MNRVVKTLSAAVLLFVVTLGFSGCKSDATSVGAVGKSDSLANEPDVTFKDLQGNDVKLSELQGKSGRSSISGAPGASPAAEKFPY